MQSLKGHCLFAEEDSKRDRTSLIWLFLGMEYNLFELNGLKFNSLFTLKINFSKFFHRILLFPGHELLRRLTNAGFNIISHLKSQNLRGFAIYKQ